MHSKVGFWRGGGGMKQSVQKQVSQYLIFPAKLVITLDRHSVEQAQGRLVEIQDFIV